VDVEATSGAHINLLSGARRHPERVGGRDFGGCSARCSLPADPEEVTITPEREAVPAALTAASATRRSRGSVLAWIGFGEAEDR
jgi:hypothetical protein